MPKFKNSSSASLRSTRGQSRRGSSQPRWGRERSLSVRSQLRDQPDLSKIARAAIAHAMAQTEAEAQAEREGAAGREHPDA